MLQRWVLKDQVDFIKFLMVHYSISFMEKKQSHMEHRSGK